MYAVNSTSSCSKKEYRILDSQDNSYRNDVRSIFFFLEILKYHALKSNLQVFGAEISTTSWFTNFWLKDLTMLLAKYLPITYAETFTR